MTQDGFAISVNNISKVYQLWNSSKERLFYPIKRLMTFVIPSKSKNLQQQTSPYREFYALNDISFNIPKGESWGFIGVNGSGKSTLLKIIAGNLKPTSGHVDVDGTVAILDYSSGFHNEFTGRENIYIKAGLLGLTRKQIKERFDAIVAFAELGEFINQPVKTYSSGMIARLGFAIVAHVDADIIIADEALAVGDIFFVQKCMAFIQQFIKRGTFLFVSHSTTDIMKFCNKAVWLEQGNIKEIGPATKVAEAYLNNIKKKPPKASQDTIDKRSEQQSDPKSIVILGHSSSKSSRRYASPRSATCGRDPEVSPNITNFYKNKGQNRSCPNTATHRKSRPLTPLFETNGKQDTGGAKIIDIILLDAQSMPISHLVGGELVTVHIQAVSESTLYSPILGFQLLDRLGQVLLANDSFLHPKAQPSSVLKPKTIFSAKFTYSMPLLPAGDYVMRGFVACMNEQEEKPIILHTLNNTLAFQSITTGMRHGLIGIPMYSIALRC